MNDREMREAFEALAEKGWDSAREVYQAAWQHQQAKIDSLQSELAKARQPVSDETLQEIFDLQLKRESDYFPALRSILERK